MASKFPQRITAIVTVEVDAEGLDWAEATKILKNQIAQTDNTYLKKVIRLEVIEEGR